MIRLGNRLLMVALMLVVGIAFVACNDDNNGSTKKNISSTKKSTVDPFPIEIATGDNLVQGQNLYNQHCAACHGTDGEGEQPDPFAPGSAPPHDASGHTWHHPDQANLSTVLNGGVTMPGFSDKLSTDEALLILGYIKTWWGEDELEVQRQRTEAFADSQ